MSSSAVAVLRVFRHLLPRQEWAIEVAVTGDSSQICRNYAQESVKTASKNNRVVQGVLNFKESEKIIGIKPDRNFLAKNNFSVSDFANSLRQIIFGPVADKWIQDGKEIDIRTIGLNKKE